MDLRISPALGVLLLTAHAAAQAPAKAALYTRTEDGLVRAAIQIDLEPRWHIYHQELGHPKAVGQATKIELSGAGIEWSAVRFPEPIRIDQSDVAGPGVFILAHENRLVLYAAGRLGQGATGTDVKAKIRGLVCEDVQGCIPYRAEVSSEGRGPDALFAKFPADLVAPGAATAEASATGPPAGERTEAQAALPSQSQAESTPEAQAEIPPEAQAEIPKEDSLESGSADATLYTRVEQGEVRAALQIAIDPGWHLYHTSDDLGFAEPGSTPTGKPTRLELHGAGITWEKPVFPKPIRIDQSEWNGPGAYINAHEGTITVYARGKLAPGAPAGAADKVWGEIHGQTCADLCIDYDETFVSRGRGPDPVWAGWEAAFAAAGSGSVETSPPVPEEEGLLLFLLAAIGWGLFTLVMPCTYPMIPITISFFTKQADQRGGTPLALSLAYGAGIVLVFVLIGAVFGSVIIPFATHPVTNLVIGIAFLYFAFVLFGVVNLQPPRFLLDIAGAASTRGGYVGVFLMGATLVVTSFTCTAPFVGSLLSFGASGGDLGRVALGMTVFGLTMAVPFVALSLVPGRIRALPRSGEWMNTLKVFMGFVEVAAALKFFSNSDLVWHWQLLSRELFLLLWGVIFAVAALYLFGAFARGSGVKPGPRRLVSGAAALLFALYCLWGMSGKKLDFVMTALAPPYSGGLLGWNWYQSGSTWPIVADDYERALEQAKRDGKLLFLNFTGVT